MKKVFFSFLIVLFVIFTSVAFAECSSSCNCNSVSTENGEYEYTQEVILGDFHIFVPVEFNAQDEINGTLVFYPNGAEYQMPGIGLQLSDTDSHYSSPAEFYRSLKEFSDADGYRVIKADQCRGIMQVIGSDSIGRIIITTANQKDFLHIIINTRSLEESLALANGIIEHIIAPEIPL